MTKRTPASEPDIIFEPAEEFEAALDAEPVADEPEVKPRWEWEATGADGRAAEHGAWRIRVQQLGGSGLWRPLIEYVGADFRTEEAAERALERVLR